MTDQKRKIEYWRDKPITEMTREELIDALQAMADREAASYAMTMRRRIAIEQAEQRKSMYRGLLKMVFG